MRFADFLQETEVASLPEPLRNVVVSEPVPDERLVTRVAEPTAPHQHVLGTPFPEARDVSAFAELFGAPRVDAARPLSVPPGSTEPATADRVPLAKEPIEDLGRLQAAVDALIVEQPNHATPEAEPSQVVEVLPVMIEELASPSVLKTCDDDLIPRTSRKPAKPQSERAWSRGRSKR